MFLIILIKISLYYQSSRLCLLIDHTISKGNLYTMITLTGNRSILPLACAWAPSEKGDCTDMFLDLLHNELHRIKSCHNDESGIVIGSIEKNRY